MLYLQGIIVRFKYCVDCNGIRDHHFICLTYISTKLLQACAYSVSPSQSEGEGRLVLHALIKTFTVHWMIMVYTTLLTTASWPPYIVMVPYGSSSFFLLYFVLPSGRNPGYSHRGQSELDPEQRLFHGPEFLLGTISLLYT
jgi:hypothetical protein